MEMNRVREHFLSTNEFLPNCTECKLAEEAGGWSLRKAPDLAGIIDNYPTRFEVKLGNLCNLACRICDPLSSSKWVKELSEQNLISASDFAHCKSKKIWTAPTSRNDVLRMLPRLKQLHFTGGEPLIEKEHIDIVQMAIETGAASDIDLIYNSNGTVFDEKIVKYWMDFRYVTLNLSIDDVGPRYEYERYGAQWDKVKENLKKYRILQNENSRRFGFVIFTTVSIFNVYYLDEIMAELAEIVGSRPIHLSVLYLPLHYNIMSLPAVLKSRVTDKIKDAPNIGPVLSYMNAEDWSYNLPITRETISRDDRYRGQNFSQVFPEIAADMGLS